ncbi:MAG: ribokinase [Candidatus Lokiarchaeota archaeon]|nr:ribokinase [Candidatus Lokiarchaeota archaeon]
MKPSVCVIGSSNTDLTIKSKKLPAPSETVLGDEFFIAAGGKGANQAVAARRAGAEVIFIAKIGDDSFGKNNIEKYNSEGIDTSHIIIDKDNHSGIALIMVDEEGENLIGVASNSNFNFKPEEVDERRDIIKEADIILLQNEIPPETNRRIIEIADEVKTPVILNPAPGPDKPYSEFILKRVDYLTPNKKELELVSGYNIKTRSDIELIGKNIIQELGAQTLIVTLGVEGCMLIEKKQTILIPAYKVKAIDTVGAGDCFNGYLGAMLASDKDIQESIKISAASAALSVQKRGAQPSLPKIGEVKKFLKNYQSI